MFSSYFAYTIIIIIIIINYSISEEYLSDLAMDEQCRLRWIMSLKLIGSTIKFDLVLSQIDKTTDHALFSL